MQTNFQDFTAPPGRGKKVVALELVWSPEDAAFVVPMPEPAKMKLLWDNERGTVLPIPVGEQMLFREREAMGADGVMFRERIIYRDAGEVTARTIEQQKLINEALWLQRRRELLEILGAFRPFLILGIGIALVFFIWKLCVAVGGAATLIGEQIGLALAELAYYAAWGVGILACALVLKFVLPLVFRGGSDTATAPAAPGSGPENHHGVTINVQQGGGSFGSQSEAQNIVNSRRF